MKREDFDHVIRAAADVVSDELVVVGSQAILAQYPNAPDALLRSSEVDLYPRNAPDRAIEVDASLGDGSRFHQTYDVYAHGVGPETVTAPAGWEERLVRLELPTVRGAPAVAWCLEVHDLVLAKLAAGRPHDREFVLEAVRAGLVEAERLRLGVGLMPVSERDLVSERLEGSLEQLARES